MIIEGGINNPSVPDPINELTIMYSGYFLFLSSGKEIFPIVAHVAAEEPEMAEKTAQLITLVCSKRPGKGSSQGEIDWNKEVAILERNNISPIQIKSGSDVSVQLVSPLHILIVMAPPIG